MEADLAGQLVLGELGHTERREVRVNGQVQGVLGVILRDVDAA